MIAMYRPQTQDVSLRTITDNLRHLAPTGLTAAVALGALTLAGCAEAESPDPAATGPDATLERPSNEAAGTMMTTELEELETFVSDYLEVDELGGGPGDANTFSEVAAPGGDPADGTDHAQLPPDSGAEFIDWDDLGSDAANHRLLDDFKRDANAFPRKDPCVAESNVLSKMDLTYVATANNSDYAYFGVQRRNNNGDAGYYWLLTENEPERLVGEGSCKSDEYLLRYDIHGAASDDTGDLLLVGHFQGSGAPLIRLYRATRSQDDVPADAAIDFTSDLWSEIPLGEGFAAVNTTEMDPGSFGAEGVDAIDADGDVGPEIFAESGLPFELLTSGDKCGASFYGTIITRPSGSGGPNPDLKDLAGPAIFNFGQPEASATLQPMCGLAFRYDVTDVTGVAGTSLPEGDYECEWTFTNSSGDVVGSSTACTGTFNPASAGTYTGDVVVTITTGDLCTASTVAGSVDVYESINTTATLDATCDGANDPYETRFTYYGSTTGGSGDFDVQWEFSGETCESCTTSPDTSSELQSASSPGTVYVDQAGETYRGELVVVDNRPGVVDAEGNPTSCAASDADSATPYAPIRVSLMRQSGGGMCPDLSTDAASWSAVVSGGDAAYTFDWTVDACDGATMCTIDPSDSVYCAEETLQLSVDDGTALCPAATSEQERYAKVTTITATDN